MQILNAHTWPEVVFSMAKKPPARCSSMHLATTHHAMDGSGQTFEGVCKTRPPYREVLTR